jgi:mono/diheme cytochrome c family protein
MRRLLSSLLVITTACALGDYSGGLAGNATNGSDGGPGSSDGGVAGDLPCDVAALLSTHCTSCHGSPPTGGAPVSLDSLATLTAPAAGFAASSYAQRSLVRMQDSASPMPPGTGVTVSATEIAAFSSWVNAGTPAGSCGSPVDPVFGVGPKCSSNQFWTRGNSGSSLMHPGDACIACHRTSGEGPTFSVAGTVYPTGHEPTDCDGAAAAGATVTVTDKNGTSRSFSVNSAGNFYGQAGSGWPVFPITARVDFNGKTRSMATAVPSGDCNTCHTQNGTAVGGIPAPPGRIALP